MAEKWHAPAVPADAEEVLSKVPTTKPANPGRVAAGQKLAERNRLGYEAKKNQKPPEAPAEEKKKSESPSGGVNSYLLPGIDGLVVSAVGVYYQREAIMTTLRRTPAPGKDVASAPEPKPKPNPAAIFG